MPDSAAAEVGDPSTRTPGEDPAAHGLRFDRTSDTSNAGEAGKEWGSSGKDAARDPRISSISSGAKYKSMSPARLPIAARSPCLGIAPGLSPTTLLESPVLLTNIKAEPSPTTGTYSVPSVVNCIFRSDTLASHKESSNASAHDDGNSGDFEFKPHISSCSMSGPTKETLACTQGQPENTCLASHDLPLLVSAQSPVVETINSRDHEHVEVTSDGTQEEKCSSSKNQSIQIDDNGSDPITGSDRTSDDGYNWRKYGQKHVKGSEFPRSYYKCTHPNCQVKKQLERSHDGKFTEIVYKGTHDHPKPQPNRRLAAGGILSCQEEEKAGRIFSFNSVEEAHMSHPNDQYGALGPSPASISDDETEGAVVRCNNNGEDVVDNDDPEAKKRRKETAIVDVSQMGKATREPRVVVQTLSEVDILDDGYRWRKYGQKVVKGNPNPRSYYKCTNMGCSVRKHVERASHDPKAVITTYEGKHNHDVSATRTSSHDTAALMAMNECSVHHSQIPTTFSSLQIIYESGAVPHQFNHAEENDTISLDLGVGLSPRPKDKEDEQRETHKTEQIQRTLMIQTATSGYNQLLIQSTSVSPRYGNSNHGMDCFVPKEEKADGFSFNAAPLNYSSNPYQANLGSLLTGP